MLTSNPLDILLAHDRWATKQILQTCQKLSSEQFHQKFDIGPGSLHAAALHILSAMRAWDDVLAGRPQRPRLDEGGTQKTPAELLMLLEESADDFAATAKLHPLEETVVRTRGGKQYTFTRGGVITHVTTHGMHHRAQCLNMLRHLGVNPLPPSSVTEWARMVDFPQ